MLTSVLILLAGTVTLDRTSVPAAGKQIAHATIDSFGRYGITVQSKQGVALQVIDRAAGPGEIFGRPGAEDGRLDLFFDRGTYRIVAHGDAKNEGQAKITVHPYRELNGASPPALVELRPIDLTLGDFEQRSYWIDLKARRTVVLEAAGRNLTDLRLWRDGSWLVDREPMRDTTEPNVGKPLTVFRMVADLEPGLYLVTAYGGPANAWAEDDGRHPFHLRYGIPSLPSALRKRYQIGPFGYDRYLVSGANFFRIELPEAKPMSLEVTGWSEAQPFRSADYVASIAKNTVPPVAELDTGSEGSYVVTVSGTEAEPYVLQHFRSLWHTPLPRQGTYWISTVHSGHAEDSIDATGIVVDADHLYRPLLWQAVKLSGDRPWGRRFNSLEQSTVFFEVEEAGTYKIVASGAEATFRIEPFLISRPPNYRQPGTKESGSEWDLDKGLFVLTVIPERKGIVEVTLSRGGFFGSLKSLFASKKEVRLPQPQLRFQAMTPKSSYWLYFNHQPGVRAGVVARVLPIDVREALPLTQSPHEVIEIPATIAEEGILYAEAEDGSRLDISVDGDGWSKTAQPSLGPHQITVRHSGEHLISYSLSFRPKRLEADTPLPKLPDGRLEQLPNFPVLADDGPRHLDLERDSEQSFLVRSRAPALFRLESTGLLATEGNLRTRMVTSVVRAQQNGIGRNFLVQQYLGTGDYQITVKTLGRTKGHLGVRLKRTPEQNGGRLVDRVPARATLAAGSTIVYPFSIPKAGQYRLRAIGRGRTLRCRLEDADGWPLVTPNVEADFDRWFDAGKYRLVVLPEAVDVRVVAQLEEVRPPLSFAGHGPHALPLDQTIAHIWIESARGEKAKPEARRPDIWAFEVPAAIDATIELTGKMHGDLIREEQAKRAASEASVGGREGFARPGPVGRERVGYVPPLRGWSGKLSPGKYRLEIQNLHETSDVPYTIAVRPSAMVVGLTRPISASANLELAIGQRALVELSSFGSMDVQAKLIDPQGRTIAKSDDRPDDWNFHLAARLDPGAYRLVVSNVGGDRGLTELAVRSRDEVLQATLQIPVKKRTVVDRKVHVHPLSIPENARFLALEARSSETLGLVLEEEDDAAYRVIGTSVGRPARIELPLAPGAAKRKHRIKLWSADERNLPIDLTIVAIQPVQIDEDDLNDGEKIEKAADLPLAVAEVELSRPGTFRVVGDVRWSSAPGVPVRAPLRKLIHPGGTRVWLVKDTRQKSVQIRGKRQTLERGQLDFQLSDRSVDVDLRGDGPVLVRVDAAKAQPGICVLAAEEKVRPACLDVHERGAISAHLLEGEAIARVWAANEAADPFDASIEVIRFEEAKPSTFGPGTRQGTIAAGAALAFDLSGGSKRISAAMEEGLVAVLADGTKTERVAWSNGSTERFIGNGTRLVLLNPLAEAATYSLEVLPQAPVTLSVPYERRPARAGREQLIVPVGTEQRRLHVRGGAAVLIETSGAVQRGEELLLGAGGGLLRIEHGTGMLMAWIDPPGAPGAGLFAQATTTPVPVSIPSAISLSGTSQAVRFESQEALAIHVRLDAPMLARWERQNVLPEILMREEGGTLDLHLPPGRGVLTLRPMGGGSLFGAAEVTSSPIQALREGLGPEVMIAPGAGRAFVFEVKQAGPIGIGVRSDASEVEAMLSRNGKTIGRGVVQLHSLEAGTYLLRVYTPDGARPARARPAIVGIEAPPSGPPAEIVQGYLRAAGYEDR